MADTMHLTKICPDCLKKYRSSLMEHQSVETCQSEFPRLNQMRSICESSCSRNFFSRFTYSSTTKSLHGDLDDFYEVKAMFPNAFKIDLTRGKGIMRFFTILNKRAHAFICEKCGWIKIAKVQTSALRNPDDYKINHECKTDDSMASAASTPIDVQGSYNEQSSSSMISYNYDMSSSMEGSFASNDVSTSMQ